MNTGIRACSEHTHATIAPPCRLPCCGAVSACTEHTAPSHHPSNTLDGTLSDCSSVMGSTAGCGCTAQHRHRPHKQASLPPSHSPAAAAAAAACSEFLNDAESTPSYTGT